MKLLPFIFRPLCLSCCFSLCLGILASSAPHISSFTSKFVSLLKNPPLPEALHSSPTGITFLPLLPVDFYASHFHSTFHKLAVCLLFGVLPQQTYGFLKCGLGFLLNLIVLAPLLLSASRLANQSLCYFSLNDGITECVDLELKILDIVV